MRSGTVGKVSVVFVLHISRYRSQVRSRSALDQVLVLNETT